MASVEGVILIAIVALGIIVLTCCLFRLYIFLWSI
ncbi:hypothetical protein HacjB3_05250 [Halalkalicoccus jeotgali B3]|uniref:Uncharacterized protein n=1 Tax=Halalkalicoccus jeotgali (strain DSM 18796 / CECT 7217 / JCM 14584 / KCTC 4019 / B3) TaxID=795797 RepID=D8J9M9_HALJB|nr:hypothetical protein HacjB3_05250 [Halalkalicoccus jeotgali B3]